MIVRPYTPADRDAALRAWREIGWVGEKTTAVDHVLEHGRCMVGELDGAAECLVANATGTLRHLREDLPFIGVMGVGVSHVARRIGLAARVTAASLARDVADGGIVAGLGMFEQGYYDRLGFGTGGYEYGFEFDPGRLIIPERIKWRPPRRVDKAEAALIHANRRSRRLHHGAVSFDHSYVTEAEIAWQNKAFGLGYYDDPDGGLSHHVMFSADEIEHGPYRVIWFAYRTNDQLLELLAVVHSMTEQVRLVKVPEPPGVQLFTMLRKPWKAFVSTHHASAEHRYRVIPWWQMRICDVGACLARTKLSGSSVRFNLELTDPIERYLDDATPWRGTAGSYVVTLGPESGAESGSDPTLPTLRTTINSFTRLWLGVRPASALEVTDDFVTSPELLEALDDVVRLPEPQVDWDF